MTRLAPALLALAMLLLPSCGPPPMPAPGLDALDAAELERAEALREYRAGLDAEDASK